MTVQDQVDRLIDERPGRQLLTPVYEDPARQISDIIFRSSGTTAAYVLLTDGGRVIVNTGLGFEAPHHKRVFDAVRPGPTHYIITTQAHVDHLGGVGLFREPDTTYLAQANNLAVPGRRRPHPGATHAHRGHLVRHARDRCHAHRQREPGRADAPGHPDT